MTEIYRRTMPGGPDVAGYRLPGRTVSIGILTGAGAASDPAGLSGLSHVLSQAVFARTSRRSEDQLRLALEETGLQADSAVNPEWSRYWVRGLADDLPRALPLLAECVVSPALEETDVAAARARARGAVLRRREKPELYVSDILRAAIFAGHPLGNATLGTPDGIGNVSVPDAQAFHDLHYRPANMVLGVAGEFDWAEVLDLAEASFPAAAPVAPPTPASPPDILPRPAVAGELQPKRWQHVGMALPGPAYADPDFYVWAVATHILGWGFSSRLFREVREQRRLTYAVAARLVACSRVGHVILYGTTTPDRAGDFAAAVMQTVRRLATDGVSPGELAAATTELTSELVMRGESTAARMHTVLTSAFAEPEIRGIGQIKSAIERVRPGDIKRILAAWRPDPAPAMATVGPVPAEEVYSHVRPVLQSA